MVLYAKAQNLWLSSQRSFYSVNIILLRCCSMLPKPYNDNTILFKLTLIGKLAFSYEVTSYHTLHLQNDKIEEHLNGRF